MHVTHEYWIIGRSPATWMCWLITTLWSQGAGTEGLGASGVQGRSPGGGLGRSPRSQIYTDSLQLSNAFLRRFVAESVLHLPQTPPQKTSDLRESHDTTRPGQGGQVPTRGYAIVDNAAFIARSPFITTSLMEARSTLSTASTSSECVWDILREIYRWKTWLQSTTLAAAAAAAAACQASS